LCLEKAGDWIQGDLGIPTFVTRIITQGRYNSFHNQWITSYKVAYGNSTEELQTIQNENGTDLARINCSLKISAISTLRKEEIFSRFRAP